MTINFSMCLVQDCGGRAVDTLELEEPGDAAGDSVGFQMPVCGPHLKALKAGAPYTRLGNRLLLS